MNTALSAMRRRHPEVFERLRVLGDADFLIDPVDLPFCLVLRPGAARPYIDVVGDGADVEPLGAVIRGPLLTLIDLLEGRVDGDALFFSRDLAIEGDMEAVLILRNAVEDGDVDVVEDLLSVLGPLKQPARRVVAVVAAGVARATQDLATLRAAVVQPIAGQSERQAAEIGEIEDELATLRHEMRRLKVAAERSDKVRSPAS